MINIAQWEAIKRCPGHYVIYRRLIVNHHPWYSGHNSSLADFYQIFRFWLLFTSNGYQR